MLGSRFILATFATLFILFTLVEAQPLAKKPAAPSADSLFCASFKTSCIKTAIQGKKNGKVTIKEGCQRNGGKYSTSYSFHCSADGKDLTDQALKQIGDGYSLTSTQGSTVVITGTSVLATLTQFSTATSVIQQTSTATSTSVESVDVTETQTAADVSSTTLTTVIPVTATEVAYATETQILTLTSSETTSTTRAALVFEPLPLQQVVIGPAAGNGKRYTSLDSSTFCSSFSTACGTVCGRLGSKPRHAVCRAKSQNNYSLACVCSNRKVETQHALLAILSQYHYTTVTALSTSTTFIGVTSTQTVPTTIYSTSLTTETAIVPVTSTYTTSTTILIPSTVTEYTGVSSVIATTTPTSTITTTTSTTTTTVTSTSTLTVVLPTGVVNAVDASGKDLGGLTDTSGFGTGFGVSSVSKAAPIVWMAVQDPASGLYSLQTLDGTKSWASQYASAIPDFESRSISYAWTQLSTIGSCGSASTAAGPAAGKGTANRNTGCQNFIFKAQTDGTLNLNAVWVNPAGSATKQYPTVWGLYSVDNSRLQQIADLAFYTQYGGGTRYKLVTLTFPNAA